MSYPINEKHYDSILSVVISGINTARTQGTSSTWSASEVLGPKFSGDSFIKSTTQDILACQSTVNSYNLRQVSAPDAKLEIDGKIDNISSGADILKLPPAKHYLIEQKIGDLSDTFHKLIDRQSVSQSPMAILSSMKHIVLG